MDYQVKAGVSGKKYVIYNCPNCGGQLKSLLTEAGNGDSCPDCDSPFTVPGEKELRALKEATALRDEQARILRDKEAATAHQAAEQKRQRHAEQAEIVAQKKIALEAHITRQGVNTDQDNQMSPNDSNPTWRHNLVGALVIGCIFILIGSIWGKEVLDDFVKFLRDLIY